MTVPIAVGISLAAPLERVHTFTLRGREGIDMLATGIDIVVADRDRFIAELTTVQLGSIAVDSLAATPYVAMRTPQLIAADNLDAVHFGIVRTGRCVIFQDGREAVQLPGVVGIVRSSAPYRGELTPSPGPTTGLTTGLTTGPGTGPASGPGPASRTHVIHTTVPMSALPGKAANVAALTATALPKTALIAAATNFLGTVSFGLPQPGSAAATFVEHAIVDLLLAVIAERTAESLPAESVEAGTRVRIRDFVLRRLPDAELGPQRIAVEFGISTRYLHRLFESEDTSVGSFIRSERLKKAAVELADPTLRHLDLKAIAKRSGFAGADQFARAFKSRYGQSPRDYRRSEKTGLVSPRDTADAT